MGTAYWEKREKMKQLEFFHKEISDKPNIKPRRTYKETFRMLNGYDHEHKCGDCIHFVRYMANRTWFKCELLGITSSASTDIRVKDVACMRWEERREDEID